MIYTIVEFIVSILVLSSVVFAGRKNILAWPLLILGQTIFLAYAIVVGMPGFFLLNIGMIIAGFVNWRLWRKAKLTPAVIKE